jgi:hypothetical protein
VQASTYFIAEWTVQSFRDTLEDHGEREKSDGILRVAGDGGLGVTDPVSGPVVLAQK